MSEAVENTETFEDILRVVGAYGSFQKRFNLVFNLAMTVLIIMPYQSMLISMMVPDHWCHVPGRNLTNLTVTQWKWLTIPMKDTVTYSSCTMYNITSKDRTNLGRKLEIVACQYGWEYNRDWYKQTIPTQENWVCENELRVMKTFTALQLGELFGGILSGLFTDTLGRKPTYYVAALTMIIGRLAILITTGSYYMFLLAAFISSLPSTSMTQSPMIIAMEITNPENRAVSVILQQLALAIGTCCLPGVMWLTGDWLKFTLILTLPGLVGYLITASRMIESPRWLQTRGRQKDCITVLRNIAKVNKTPVPGNIEKLLEGLPKNTEKPMGYWSLLLHWRIVKNTICSAVCNGAYQVTYYVLILNISNVGGNPLLNFFLLSLALFPGYMLSKVSVDYFGRRFTHAFGFSATALGCIPLIILITDHTHQKLISIILASLTFTASIACYSINLQVFELYPTCLRQTGASVCTISANTFALLAPYVVHMGTSIDARLPYIMVLAITVIGAVCGFLLPETLHCNLPDTIAESATFGSDQSFWNLPKKRPAFELINVDYSRKLSE